MLHSLVLPTLAAVALGGALYVASVWMLVAGSGGRLRAPMRHRHW